jgi:hypothetical protein
MRTLSSFRRRHSWRLLWRAGSKRSSQTSRKSGPERPGSGSAGAWATDYNDMAGLPSLTTSEAGSSKVSVNHSGHGFNLRAREG